MHNVEYQLKALRPLLGATFTDILTEDGYIGLVLHPKKDGEEEQVLWIQIDPEGNGPGWINVSVNHG